jgi:hypothetical protein
MWIITAWQHFSPEVFIKGAKKCCISSVIDGTNDDSCRTAVKRMGMPGVCVKKMKAINVKIDTVTLIGKDRI